MKENLKLGWSQDQHLFHKRLGVNRPIEALMRAFPDDEFTSQLDVIVYGGDFFDHEVSNANPDLPIVDEYMAWRLIQAKKHNYAVRVLEGTKSHDRAQCKRWETIHKILGSEADFKYIDTLMIESHPILGDVLYIPDNWKPDLDEVWVDVKAALKAKNLEKVDWAFVHGPFDSQLPSHLGDKVQMHKAERYAEICRKYCLTGHVHIKSQYKNVIGIGSLDRLCHGEEEPKGTLRIECDSSGNDLILFQENVFARISKTLDVRGLSLEEVADLVTQATDKYGQEDISLRFLCNTTDEAYFNVNAFERRFPGIEFSVKKDKQKDNHLINLSEPLKVSSKIDLSIGNATKLLIEAIGDKLTDTMHEKILEVMK